jgi:hypothetical protein
LAGHIPSRLHVQLHTHPRGRASAAALLRQSGKQQQQHFSAVLVRKEMMQVKPAVCGNSILIVGNHASNSYSVT